MKLRDDPSRPALVELATLDWIPSPRPGVDRKLLERDGGEVARATTVVRYAPGASFPAHDHGGGEEFFVLRGVFSDEHGDYPAGSYSRAPWGSRHAPFSRDGCEIFVKLCHLPADATRCTVREGIDLHARDAERLLFEGPTERVRVISTPRARVLARPRDSAVELLLLHGTVRVGSRVHDGRTWVRLPTDDVRPIELGAGSTAWVKLVTARPSPSEL